MPSRNIDLTRTLNAYVEERVRSGAYPNASEVIRDALRLHKARTKEVAKIERFNRLIQEGDDDIAAGRYAVIEFDQLDAWFERLRAEIGAERATAKANGR
jgi:putative addiction module CopG family antidote